MIKFEKVNYTYQPNSPFAIKVDESQSTSVKDKSAPSSKMSSVKTYPCLLARKIKLLRAVSLIITLSSLSYPYRANYPKYYYLTFSMSCNVRQMPCPLVYSQIFSVSLCCQFVNIVHFSLYKINAVLLQIFSTSCADNVDDRCCFKFR